MLENIAPERLLVVGSDALARRVVETIRNGRNGGTPPYEYVGAVGEVPRGGVPPLLAPLRGPVEALPRILDAGGVDCVVVALDEGRDGLPLRKLLHAKAQGVRVERAQDLYERLTGKIDVEALTPRDVIFATGYPQRDLTSTLARTVSAAASALALVLLAPLMLAIAGAIRLDSPGPVLFVQDRVGLRGRTFRLYKFRTMRADERSPSEWVRDNGHRITPIGYWLRRFRLDELPQLINVLRGEMNLVGPRPHPAANYTLLATVMRNVAETGTDIPYYSLRTLVRPGITGWAQVRYGYANGVIEEVEKLKYDLYYVKHRSPWLDLRILVETVGVVVLSRTYDAAGAAGPSAQPGEEGPRAA
jgi:exopolysaccharide biosynthesis polyprenyl glycosylphosphotransferase